MISGVDSVYTETFGCAHNVSDGEYMKELLSKYGFKIVEKEEISFANVWVIDSCTMKDPSS